MIADRLVHCCIILLIIACFIMPVAAVPGPADYEKSLQIRLGYLDGKYSLLSQEIIYGKSPNLAILSGPFRGVITDSRGSEIMTFSLMDPGIAAGESVTGPSGTDFVPYTERRSAGEMSLVLPFTQEMQTVSLFDTGTGSLLVSADIQPAYTLFCLDYPFDPDCTARAVARTTTGTAPDIRQLLVIVFLESILVAGVILSLTTRRKAGQPLPAVQQTVLVVDDSPDIIEIVSYALTRKGYHCVAASGGQECLDFLVVQKPDVILLDIVMEPLDGWSTLRQIKKNPETKSIPVLMLTANKLTAQDARHYHICIEDYIRKPFREEELSAAIEQILARKKVLRESLAIARKAGVDKEKFCQLAALSTRVSVDRKIISILEKPDEEMLAAGKTDPEKMEVISELIQNTRSKEVQMEELKSEIHQAFMKKGFVPPSW
ncbi:MAG: response regulator [Methanoregula sp.]